MGELIIFNNRRVKAKGLNRSAKPDESKVKTYFFSEDYQNLSLLNVTLNLAESLAEKPILFYPGCGADILFPAKYVEKLFPTIKEIKFVFNDADDNLSLIKTVLDDVGISFAENDTKFSGKNNQNNSIKFYWNNILIDLEFIKGNVFGMELPNYDIYFERAFAIMKSYHSDYENKIFAKLNSQGILISDSGFQGFPLKKIAVPKKLSPYGEMIVGIKQS